MNYELASAIRSHSDGPGLSCGQWFDRSPVLAPIQGCMTLTQHIRAQGVLADIEARKMWPPRTLHNEFSVRNNIALR